MNIGPSLTLASASTTRLAILHRAGFTVAAQPARVDEAAIREALVAAGTPPRDIADALAEAKAQKVARRFPGLVLGCDQILACDGRLFSKAADRVSAASTIAALQGRTHSLHSAIVVFLYGEPVWRHVAESQLTMRRLDPDQTERYLDACWPGVADAVGCYHIEGEGLALFRRIDGEQTAILGLPLPPFISWLDDRGDLT